jgi:LPS-assembly protein
VRPSDHHRPLRVRRPPGRTRARADGARARDRSRRGSPEDGGVLSSGSEREDDVALSAKVAPRLLLLLLASPALGQQTFSQPDPYESRFRTKPNFQIKFHAPEKGGEVRLYTRKPVHYEKDVYWEGSEEVRIEYQDIVITGDAAHFDFPTRTATLVGHVVIDQGPTRLSGSRGTFQLDSKTGTVEAATADLPPTYHIVADSIDKIGEATYRVHHGIFTACDLPKPDWSFAMSEATVTLDDYARLKDVSFRARTLPVLYTPYLLWPTKEGRVSGLLVPALGFTGRRGAYLGLSHYWVTGRSTDLTTQVDLFSKGGAGIGEEFRWTPSRESAGIFQGYLVHDPDATTCVPPDEANFVGTACILPNGQPGLLTFRKRNRWKIRLDHVSDDLPWGMRAVVSIRDYSDVEYLDDFERSFSVSSLREILSRAFLTQNAGADSFNLRIERNETFLGATVMQERLPTLEYFHRTSQIGQSPFYFAAEASLSDLYLHRGGEALRGSYGRADFHPTLSLPWKGLPWLSLTATGGGRWTGYTESTDAAQTQFLGSSTQRDYVEGGLSLVGPSFSRIFDAAIGPFAKFKHVIEPRVDYSYVSNVDHPERIPAFDDIDTALGRNQVRYALVNRLLAKPDGPTKGSAIEIASLEISQTYAFELPQTNFGTQIGVIPPFRNAGPIEADLRFTPGGPIVFDGRVDYDQKNGQIVSNSVTASFGWKTNFVNATWFGTRPVLATPLPPGSPSPNTDQIRFAGGFDIAKPIRFDTEINYDVRQNQILEDRSLLTYRGSCYEVFVELRQLRVPGVKRNDVRFVLNLKDIGTLIDLNGALRPNLF